MDRMDAMRRALRISRERRLNPRARTDAEINATLERKYRQDSAESRGERVSGRFERD